MKTTRTLLIALTLSFVTAAVAMAASPQMGTWKLNESKSKFSSKARNHTVTYTAAKGDMIKVDVVGVDKDGKPLHWDWVGKFDGKPYKMHHNPVAEMAAYKMVNDHTNEITMTKGDKKVLTTEVKVAKDGKSRTVTTTFAGQKKMADMAVYDKM